MLSLLRAELIRSGEKYMEREYVAIYAKDAYDKAYIAYHGLGGNGTMTQLHTKVMELPTQNDNQEEIFGTCYKLKNVRFVPKTLSVDLSLADCSELKKDSVVSALRACKQLETAGSAVLAFNTAVYSADLMPEIEAAVAKGFKVTFGNKIFGGTEE